MQIIVDGIKTEGTLEEIIEFVKVMYTLPRRDEYTFDKVGFTHRTLNVLMRYYQEDNGPNNMKDLAKLSECKLSSIRGFGKKALREVREKLNELGIIHNLDYPWGQ